MRRRRRQALGLGPLGSGASPAAESALSSVAVPTDAAAGAAPVPRPLEMVRRIVRQAPRLWCRLSQFRRLLGARQSSASPKLEVRPRGRGGRRALGRPAAESAPLRAAPVVLPAHAARALASSQSKSSSSESTGRGCGSSAGGSGAGAEAGRRSRRGAALLPERRGTPTSQKIFHPVDDHLRLERLHEHAVASDARARASSMGSNAPVSSTTGMCFRVRCLLYVRGHFVAVPPRHADVGKDDVGTLRRCARRLLPVTDGDHLDLLVGKRQLDHTLDGHAVVRKQELRHLAHASTDASIRRRSSVADWMNVMMSCIGLPGRKIPLMPSACSFGMSTSGMIPPTTTMTSVEPLLLEQLHHARADVHVRAGQDREADGVGIFLKRCGRRSAPASAGGRCR